MFERFTEQAINTVYDAQNYAIKWGSSEVYIGHLFCAIVHNAKGISLRLFRNGGINSVNIEEEVRNYISPTNKNYAAVPFNNNVKVLLKQTLDLASRFGDKYILYEHLFLSLLNTKNTCVNEILGKYNFDIFNAKEILNKLVQKKTKKMAHPEGEDGSEIRKIDEIYKNIERSSVFDKAVSKLTASGYEILGTEQIVSSILENTDTNVTKILSEYGITQKTFDEMLTSFRSRDAEYSGRKIVFTPNAFRVMKCPSNG